ncbi:hypothetical protein ASPZODRAFT_848740 [Penicilliopsis zonata CBS 506.65]|uniref:Uncharacterized protein n=1 Tax=Penicilliopsis zonata CBS 506.65 TaxID=1073090 RepID=A0A1L9SAP5_9EURO|nr:hypothetical protein ASPZODRAFT_848740 [Penicilliopsis zonata CBS 506.65]OJJ44179.1 hypothetical protein ASPZODRAFT_848740 [Penicilliopsis zonata CBS 506.65]
MRSTAYGCLWSLYSSRINDTKSSRMTMTNSRLKGISLRARQMRRKNTDRSCKRQLKEADSQQKRSSERDVELEEYKKLIPHIEQDRHTVQNLKKQLEFNNHALTERLKSAEEQHERDQTRISDLRERIRELEGSPGSPSYTPGSDTPQLQDTLQKDFGESQLKAENNELKKDEEDDSLKAPSASLAGQSVPYSDNFLSTTQIAQAKSTQSEEYWKLYEEFAEVRKKLAEADDLAHATMRKLEEAKADLDLTSKDKVDMAQAFKEKEDAELADLREQFDALTHKYHHVEAEADASLNLAREACNERDQLREMLDQKESEMISEDQDLLAEMQRLVTEYSGGAGDNDQELRQQSSMELVKQFADLIETNVERLAKRAEVSNLSYYEEVEERPYPCESFNRHLFLVECQAKARSSAFKRLRSWKKRSDSPVPSLYHL